MYIHIKTHSICTHPIYMHNICTIYTQCICPNYRLIYTLYIHTNPWIHTHMKCIYSFVDEIIGQLIATSFFNQELVLAVVNKFV